MSPRGSRRGVVDLGAITGEPTDRFPNGSGIDSPNSLEFTALRDVSNAPLPLGDQDNVFTP